MPWPAARLLRCGRDGPVATRPLPTPPTLPWSLRRVPASDLPWRARPVLSGRSVHPCSCLLPHHFDNHAFVTLSVEFRIEDSLPCAQVEFSRRDRHNHFVMDEQRLEMRIAIVLAGLVVLVIFAERRQMLEPLVDVFD